MIRPLIESIYDYHMTFDPETTLTARNTFKTQYHESTYLVAAEYTLSALNQPNASLQSVIGDWNNKNTQMSRERRDNKVDYKTKLDQMFKTAGKSYYRREYERPLSRQKSEDYKQPRYQSQRNYSRSRDHGYSYHPPRYQSHHKNQSYSKHRNERY